MPVPPGSNLRIGTSGWNYPAGRGTWNGVFYPIPRARWKGFDELSFYAEHFDTVEVNSTFYGQPRSAVCRKWADRTPTGFEFTNGKLTGINSIPAIFNPSTPYETVHMILACYVACGFGVAAVYATSMLRGKRDDYRKHLLCATRYHGALGIAGGASVWTERVAEYRQAFEIQIVLADAFVGFAGAAGAKHDIAADMCDRSATGSRPKQD